MGDEQTNRPGSSDSGHTRTMREGGELDPVPADRIGRYRLLQKIGKGSMGLVIPEALPRDNEIVVGRSDGLPAAQRERGEAAVR